MSWHVLYQNEDGIARESEVCASTFVEAETIFRESHPRATYWEIGFPDSTKESPSETALRFRPNIVATPA